MTRFTRLTVLALIAVVGFVAAPAVNADHHEGKSEADQAAAMQEWMKYAAPGDMHKDIAKFEGSWEATNMMWMQPGTDPMKSTGTSMNEMMLGGRYLMQNYKGTFMGQPFEGIGITGYNNYSKMFSSVWVDNMSTLMMVFEGTMNKDGQMVMTAEYKDAMSGAMKTAKSVSFWRDDDNYVFEMWEKGPDGKEYKQMEMVYSRASGEQAKK